MDRETIVSIKEALRNLERRISKLEQLEVPITPTTAVEAQQETGGNSPPVAPENES
jgi:hypothetical protein